MSARVRRTTARDVLAGLAVRLLTGVVALLALMGLLEQGRATPWFVLMSSALTLAAMVALRWRRRHPVRVAAALVLTVAVTDFTGGAYYVALFNTAARRSGRTALALAGVGLVAAVPFTLWRPDPEFPFAAVHLANLVITALVLAWGMRVRARRELVEELRRRAESAEAEDAARAERLRAEERERIAGEMHDVLAHRISLVSLHAGALEIRPDLPPDEVVRMAGTIRDTAHSALDDLREILGVLRAEDADGLRPQPGLAGLGELVAEARSAGTPVELEDLAPGGPPPPDSAGRTAYRVVQEGLTNVRKHAPGAQVRVRLERTAAPDGGGELHVWLRNRLPSVWTPSAVPGSRSGLLGLSERVRLAGGRLDSGARRGEDGAVEFHLEVWLPWPTT
ncbi:sensor histidine kinase [Allonocardiopsis opalescens]|uniref:histidine kinase n=1 Tax=Allonocardiopsis opalescens TaxID=1144618 RepID=A0A2T0PX50_9ACTN|nr:histidine kinase [Allonocardiopsis opalescens]PRX96119.1 signal transduction histidine kinase [Allonocardiopsis opalescens]